MPSWLPSNTTSAACSLGWQLSLMRVTTWRRRSFDACDQACTTRSHGKEDRHTAINIVGSISISLDSPVPQIMP